MMNPLERNCWTTCAACHRCADKGTHPQCAWCSGRVDPNGKWDPYDKDDYCDCRNGVLRYKTQTGRRILAKIPNNPFAGTVRSETQTRDEQDYQAYLQQSRERLDNPDWDPVQFSGGGSTDRWMKEYLKGKG